MRWPWPSEGVLPGDEAGLDRQLLDGPVDGLAGHDGVGVGELEEDPTGAHDGDPPLRVALARAHAGLGGLLGDGLVGEDVDPDLAATLDVAGHGDSGGLDLAVRDPSRFEGLDAEVAEVHARATLGEPGHPATLGLAVANLAGHQHRS